MGVLPGIGGIGAAAASLVLPTYVNYSFSGQATAAASPALPTGWAQNDILVMLQTCTTVIPTVVSGWSTIDSDATGINDSGTLRYSRLSWKRAGAGEVAPTLTDDGSNNGAVIAAVRGCALDSSVINQSSKNRITSDNSTWTATGFTTTVENVFMLFMGLIAGTSSFTISGQTNANLTGITERADGLTTSNIVTHHVVTAAYAGPGATGNTTGTVAFARTQCNYAVALKGL